jgi:pilus assembly protein CpaF
MKNKPLYELIYQDNTTKDAFFELVKIIQAKAKEDEKIVNLLNRNHSEKRVEKSIKIYIDAYIQENMEELTQLTLKHLMNIPLDDLIHLVYLEMAEYSILTSFLNNKMVEEINVNGWNNIVINYAHRKNENLTYSFYDQKHCDGIINRMLDESDMKVDEGDPIKLGHLGMDIRVTAVNQPVVIKGKGKGVSIRLINSQNFTLKDLLNFGTITEEMFELLNICLSRKVGMCFLGETGSGKTLLMSTLLKTISKETGKRIITIENQTHEFDLEEVNENGVGINDVLQLMTKLEGVEKPIDQSELLKTVLTMNPEILAIGEVKSADAYWSQEASRTGHGVTTSLHADNCRDAYTKLATMCIKDINMSLENLEYLFRKAFPIMVHLKNMEDDVRRVVEITECYIDSDRKAVTNTLYQFVAEDEIIDDKGKVRIIGHHEQITNISEHLERRLTTSGISQKRLEKINMEGERAYCI